MKNELLIVLTANLAAMITLIVLTYRSNMARDKKTGVYIATVLMPLLGLILFLIFNKKLKETT